MSTFLKVAIALLLTLPLAAYVTGTLVSARTDMPAERAPVVIETTPAETAGGSTGTPTARPTRKPAAPAGTDRPDDSDGRDDDSRDHDGRDRDDDRGDDDVRVVRPTPHDVGGDRDDRDDRDDRGVDNGDDDGSDDGADGADDEGGDDSSDD